MYVIKVDGQVFYSPALSDAENQIIAPKLKYKLNKSDSFSFMLPPTHAMKDALHKMKSVITVEQNGEEIFRGRAYEITTDLFNQQDVRCEGELAFLLDSLQRPYKFKGKAADYFRLMITNHNSQVEADKQYAVGTVSAVTDENTISTESTDYRDTLSEIRSFLVNRVGGYLRIRRENGVRYIDYLDKYNTSSNQKLEFGGNLLDIENHINAQEVFTVLVPLSDLEDSYKMLTIKDVNNGLDYIENPEAIAKYGRIVKYHVWRNITNPARLLELGREKLNNAGTVDTLNITAVDLNLLNAETDTIHLGDTVHIHSLPHGFDKELVCSAIDIDIFHPENTVYTFGEIEKTMSANVAENKKTSHQCHVDLRKTHSEYIELEGQVEQFYSSFSEVEIKLDAVTTTINLKADKTEMTAISQRVTSAEVAIDGANAEIALRVRENEVISAINLTTEEARIKASKIVLDGYVTASKLSAEFASLSESYSSRFTTHQMDAEYALIANLSCRGTNFSPQTINYTDHNGNQKSMVVLGSN